MNNLECSTTKPLAYNDMYASISEAILSAKNKLIRSVNIPILLFIKYL